MERFGISLQGRERTAFSVIALLFLFLLIGLFRLQVVQREKLFTQSENNRLRVVPLIPRRGLVFDRDGRVVIDNRPSYTVAVVPAEEVPNFTLRNLAELIGLDTAIIRRRVRRNTVSRYQPAPVKRDIPFSTVAVLEEQSNRFPGIHYSMERVRQYPFELLTESFTGYVGEISPQEIKKLESRRYQPGDMIGKKGLERNYDLNLRGREGIKYVEVYASGQIVGDYLGKDSISAIPGVDLRLTIDLDLQRACSESIDTFCCGAIVVMDPRNGEILAMASFPGYDANIFSSVIPDSVWKEISSDSSHPLLNRPLTGLYPPGSTTKFITVGAALEEGIIDETSHLNSCPGGMQFGNRFFRCWKGAGHGSLEGTQALAQSCDVFMYQLGLELGVDKLSEYLGASGIGRVTGVDLPGEAAGLNPDSKYYDERYGAKGWTRALVMNNSIGQGELLVTPLQVAQLFCGLANKGIVYKPHLIQAYIARDGSTIPYEPEIAFTLPFSQPVLDYLFEGMRLVVEGEDGTARSLKNDLYRLAGKTGTVQNPHGENHSWFVGVAPLVAPEIVVCVIVENAGDGSAVAAPMVKLILDAYMKKRYEIPSVAQETVDTVDTIEIGE